MKWKTFNKGHPILDQRIVVYTEDEPVKQYFVAHYRSEGYLQCGDDDIYKALTPFRNYWLWTSLPVLPGTIKEVRSKPIPDSKNISKTHNFWA
jgi:hypothetical protein